MPASRHCSARPTTGGGEFAQPILERMSAASTVTARMVFETVFDTKNGRIAVIDFMPLGHPDLSLIRLVEGRAGKVAVNVHFKLRFDYGASVPWVTRLEDDFGLSAIVGPNRVVLRTPVELRGENLATLAEFTVAKGQCVPFVLTYGQSHLAAPQAVDWQAALHETEDSWRKWCRQCCYRGAWKDAVQRSLLTLKAMTYATTGGIVAAPTTSLPEEIGGVRNWDYRYCWLRDARLTMTRSCPAGYRDEARHFRDWLLRAAAGAPDQLQIMYGLSGGRRLTNSSSRGCPDTKAPPRFVWAMPHRTSFSSMSTANCYRAIYLARKHGLPGRAGVGPAATAHRASGENLAAARRRHLGSARRPPPFHPFEGHGLGRHRPTSSWCKNSERFEDGAQTVPTSAASPRAHSRGDLHARLQPALQAFTQYYGERSSTRACSSFPMSAFCRPTIRACRAPSRRSKRTWSRTASCCAIGTHEHDDGLPAGRGRVPRLQLLARRQLRLAGRMAEARALFDRLLRLAQRRGAACRRVRAARHGGRLAISRRRFRTWRLSERP